MTGDAPGATGVRRFEDWWRDLVAAALVGTARRAVPPLPSLGVDARPPLDAAPTPPDAAPHSSGTPRVRSDEALLAGAALGGAARRAGRRAGPMRVRPPAALDVRPAAPSVAGQLLELVLTQPPAGAEQRDDLVLHWLHEADRAGCRVPHALLPTLLGLATASRRLRHAAPAVIDQRGVWLGHQCPDWGWVADGVSGHGAGAAAHSAHSADTPDPAAPDTDAEAWARLPSSERLAVLGRARTDDPAAGRALVESTWDTDPATARRVHLEALRIGLADDDAGLLERALDDRAASVRDVATTLLDALPGSARAARMAERLRPLLHHRGVLRRTLEVALPDEPDAAARRDGLTKPPRGRSARGWWLERIAAGAPLGVWTTATGVDPATTLDRLSDADALRGIRTAVRERRDAVWAAAILARTWDPALLAALPPADREAPVLARLAAGELPAAVSALGALSTPWSARLSLHLLGALGSAKAPSPHVAQAMPHLLSGLHPDALGALESWLSRVHDDRHLANQLRNLLQFHSVKRSITEAFR